MAIDLADAAIEALRATPVAAAFGDTWNAAAQTGVIKFFGDWSYIPSLPYAVIEEVGETYQYMTPAGNALSPNTVNYIADGQMTVTVLQSGRLAARQLGVLVASVMNDAALQWPAAGLMYLRMASAFFRPVPAQGPQSPTVFCRVITFNYEYSSHL